MSLLNRLSALGRPRELACVLTLTLSLPSTGRADCADCADLALVLAIDGSGSISYDDFSLQQQGYAHALQSHTVQEALASVGRVDMAVVLWGDSETAPQVMDWHRIARPADAEVLSRQILAMPRVVSGNTGIGNGLAAALDLIASGETCAARRIVNVSGDGRESLPPQSRRFIPLTLARARAVDMGVTINALAITVNEPDLADWYAGQLVTGPGAFVMQVAGFDAFADAILAKLDREIRLPQVAGLSPTTRKEP
jgi:Protein of unknown function (DUF1194)